MFKILYFEKSGKYPVVDFIEKQPLKVQAKILREIDLLKKFGSPIGMPHVRKLKGYDELWEIRISSGNNKYRIFYFSFIENNYVLLHAFQKKSQKTPKKEIALAEKRIKEYKE